MQHVFIVGAKGIPAQYGGFETFVEKLTEYQKDENIKYHVACIKTKKDYKPEEAEYEHNGAHCFTLCERTKGSSRAIFYDIDALKYSIKYIKEHNIERPIIYILACRIGPFVRKYRKKIHKLGGELYVNPDGNEWKRAKWNRWIRKYWKISEKKMVKNADLMICDSKGIESYIKSEYKKYEPKTTYIAYGAETKKFTLELNDSKVANWFTENEISPYMYYLMVGRFVPENNFARIIYEFLHSKTQKDLVIITDGIGSKFYRELEKEFHFKADARIKFIEATYDQELLKKIRELAYGYIHGHSVGGTNPSLLEAMGLTRLNLLYDVSYNAEVGGDGALYWTHEFGLLRTMLVRCDEMSPNEIYKYATKARERITDFYSWEIIRDKYEKLFLEGTRGSS